MRLLQTRKINNIHLLSPNFTNRYINIIVEGTNIDKRLVTYTKNVYK